MQKFIIKITEENAELIQDTTIECYVLTSTLSPEFITSFASQASSQKKIVLVEGENAANICKSNNLDGIILDVSSSEDIKTDCMRVQRIIGDGKRVGLITRNRRHEAMLASECEPDFVIFQAWNDGCEKVKELVAWYNELFLILSAVVCRDENVAFEDFNADIVILSDKNYKILVAKKQSLD